MTDRTNPHQISSGDCTGLQHYFRYTIVLNIISTWENWAVEPLNKL